jgi:hypothetical protein
LPEQHLLARRMLEIECAGDPANARVEARVFERLFQEVVPVIGNRGVIALLSRAIVLAKVESPSLASFTIAIDSPEALADRLRGHFEAGPEPEMAEAAITLCAMFLSLMATFVGEPLTAQFVQRAWPDINAHSEGQ